MHHVFTILKFKLAQDVDQRFSSYSLNSTGTSDTNSTILNRLECF